MARTLPRLLSTVVVVSTTAAASVVTLGTVGAGTAAAGPCSEMFGNFGSLLETGSLGN